ncbi:hypothetical protein NQ318_006654 [Aromia moschata]|uniref:Zinc transporter 1 n=1 Tax=Aromia moschata TaxID=1265417 RepID=A0AAV8YQG9_9CUCU|nr:hypothetical protein NQ318_006654 [Aromia moschata]
MGKFTGKKCRLLSMLWLTTFFFFVEIVVGYITNSMALVADSFHMLSDVAALVIAFLSVKKLLVVCLTYSLALASNIPDSNIDENEDYIEHEEEDREAKDEIAQQMEEEEREMTEKNHQEFIRHSCGSLDSCAKNTLCTTYAGQMSPKKWSKNTFGWARAEVLGALVNAVFLVALCFSITVEACKRFIEMEEIHEPRLLVAVGVIGLLVNLIGLLLFHVAAWWLNDSPFTPKTNPKSNLNSQYSEDNSETYEMSRGVANGVGSTVAHMATRMAACRTAATASLNSPSPTTTRTTRRTPSPPPLPSKENVLAHNHSAGQMNMRGVFLHVLSDALGSVIVIISALVFWLTDWKYRYYIDPALSIVLVLLILHSVWPLLRDSALILLQTVPTHIQVDAIQNKLLQKVDGVLAVHEFHVWQLAGDRIIASAHIRCRNLSEYMKIAEKVKEFFHNEGIHSTTIQPEFIDYSDIPTSSNDTDQATEDCVLDCPKTNNENDNCLKNTCCGPRNSPLAQGRDTPSPNNTPYICRQRTSTGIPGNEEMNELEKGVLLENGHLSMQCDCECSPRGSQHFLRGAEVAPSHPRATGPRMMNAAPQSRIPRTNIGLNNFSVHQKKKKK